MMQSGLIVKALSGFYDVRCGETLVECKGSGKLRYLGQSPLVGDWVTVMVDAAGKGRIESVQPRKNAFVRPAVANIDALVCITSDAIPVTDTCLVDRLTVIAVHNGCEVIICVNKADVERTQRLPEIYAQTGFHVIHTSAETGEGIGELRAAVAGKICAFTGDSGVGKSSILNALNPEFSLRVGQVSEKLGRGRHTTRHVELFDLGQGTYLIDTPGFASFDMEMAEPILCRQLQYDFPEFAPYLGQCRFQDCAHLKEPDCMVRQAVEQGRIHPKRYQSYRSMYTDASAYKEWELKNK